MNKKGQLGLDKVKLVMVAFLVLAAIALAMIISTISLRDAADDIDVTTVVIANRSAATTVNETGSELTSISNTALRNCALTVITMTNGTGGETIDAANYTISECIVTYAGEGDYNDSILWNATGSYKFTEDRTTSIAENISAGLVDFFDDTGTIFSILVVVVIILAIAIIIFAVSKFGGRTGV